VREFFSPSVALVVGQPVQPLPDVRTANACRTKYRLPNGVRFRFQVSLYKVEPAVSNRVIRLLSKDDWRLSLADESYPRRPEVTRVIKPLAFACTREGGAGAASGPDFSIIGPSGESESVGPNSDTCEEMALPVSAEVVWFDIGN
jgi:hypothetical protein